MCKYYAGLQITVDHQTLAEKNLLTSRLVNNIYIYTKIIVWCEDEKRSIPLQVERKVIVNTQGKDQLLLLRVSLRLAIFRQLTYQIYYKRI